MDHIPNLRRLDGPSVPKRADGRPSLGLAMIVKNEAKNLPVSLGPLAALFEQVVVVDTGSTDGTASMAAGYGAEVASFRWCGDFSAARNHGLGLMRTDHVMWLDADNSLGRADLGAIRDQLSGGPQILVATEVVVPQGDTLWQKRVFYNSREARFVGTVHEQLTHPASWPVVRTAARIRHWGYAEAEGARRKGQRNLELLISAPETAAGELYHLYQTGRTLMNLRYLAQAEEYLARAAWGPEFWPEALAGEEGRSEGELAGEGDSGKLAGEGESGEAGGSGESRGPWAPHPSWQENPALWSHALLLLSQVQAKMGKARAAEKSPHHLKLDTSAP
jgi:hypothetical protein